MPTPTAWPTDQSLLAPVAFEVNKYAVGQREHMKKLIIHGNPGIRKGAVIEYDGEEYVCFIINVQGEWHGPDEPQLWCTVGKPEEREQFMRREYIPMHLETEDVDAEAIDVVQAKGEA